MTSSPRSKEKYGAYKDAMEIETLESREEYHRDLLLKNALYRKMAIVTRRDAAAEEERLQRHYVALREQQLAAAAGKLASQGRKTAIRRKCKPIKPPPRKPKPVMYSTLAIQGAEVKARATAIVAEAERLAAEQLEQARLEAEQPSSPKAAGAASSPRTLKRRDTAHGHGRHDRDLDPITLPDFASLRTNLFPNKVQDTVWLAGMATTDDERAALLQRVQHEDAAGAFEALLADAHERKRRDTLKLMARRAAQIKQEMRQANVLPPTPSGGGRRFPVLAA